MSPMEATVKDENQQIMGKLQGGVVRTGWFECSIVGEGEIELSDL